MYFILKHITITPPPTSPPPKNPDLPYKPHVSLKNSSICGFTFSDYSNVYTLYSFFLLQSPYQYLKAQPDQRLLSILRYLVILAHAKQGGH